MGVVVVALAHSLTVRSSFGAAAGESQASHVYGAEEPKNMDDAQMRRESLTMVCCKLSSSEALAKCTGP
jgi:hypothetical protein